VGLVPLQVLQLEGHAEQLFGYPESTEKPSGQGVTQVFR
jgi:hypothetical protein